jgi:hypothetical protein
MCYSVEISADDYEDSESHSNIAAAHRSVKLDGIENGKRYGWIQLFRLIREGSQTRNGCEPGFESVSDLRNGRWH